MKDINSVMLNTIRMKIIQELSSSQSLTTGELCERINSVPRTTMYRHINILLDNNILTVVSEKRIRGSIERTLALNIGEISKNNTIENASTNALSFLLNRYTRFHNYFNNGNPDPAKDKIFLNYTVMMMNDKEFDKFLSELQGLIVKFNFKETDGRKARDISIISTPIEME